MSGSGTRSYPDPWDGNLDFARAVVDVDDREARIVHSACSFPFQCVVYIIRDAMKLLRPNDKIDMWQIFQQRSSARLCHAAEKTKNSVRPLVGNAAEHPHFSKRFLVSHIADAAGVQQHHVRVELALRAFIATGDERVCDLFRVALVHLATVSLNEKFRHGRAKTIHTQAA